MRHDKWIRALLLFVVCWGACSESSEEPAKEESQPWEVVASELDEAVLSVGGTSAKDVWAVGADKGKGPLALHWNGKTWERRETGAHGDLWWVHAFEDGTVFFGGSAGILLRLQDGKFEQMQTPGLARHTVFGVWGRNSRDVYAVGSASGRDGFIWHFDGSSWKDLPLPRDVALDDQGEVPGLFKIWGNETQIVAVGGHGLVLRGSAERGFQVVKTNLSAPLYSVYGDEERVFAVGGDSQGVVLEIDSDGIASDRTPEGAPLIQGVCVGHDGEVIATGAQGQVFARGKDGFERASTGLSLKLQTLHAVWLDPEGNAWAVGGNAISGLDKGAILRRGVAVELYSAPAPDPTMVPEVKCPEKDIDPKADKSIARRWNEQILAAIRRDIPRPTVHARNLYHLSAAMWDAWAAFDPKAQGTFVKEKLEAEDVAAARQEAISYAAYGVLKHRYQNAIGGPVSEACFAALLTKLGFDPQDQGDTEGTARALGNRIAKTIIAQSIDDGSNETNDYKDTTGYKSPNEPLAVEAVGVNVEDPTAFQPLNLAKAETQNGIVTTAGVQGYIGAQWNDVTPFAMTRSEPGALYHDPGEAPVLGEKLQQWAKQVVERTAALDYQDGEMMDTSPGGYGNNSLGANDGTGHPLNPVTGEAYAPMMVPRGDFARVLAEFWADGPKSETPPGHWNTLANEISDAPEFTRKWRGQGASLDALSWDVHLYLALNGAVHDAAITAWGIKRRFATARPITLIRYMAGLGQSSDPALPSYHPDGLPLQEGLIEVITKESSQPGERHAHLARHVGELAVRSYRGEPADRVNQVGGVGWIRALEWIPYQRRTFVTPAFPGFISGHSTFSRAAAEVLTLATGSAYFPGGLGEFVAKKDAYLVFERGPSTDVHLQWATYYDAADQAGQSRIFGGIHIEPDDFVGRKMGSLVGLDAFQHAESYFVDLR